jgi:hypothetical protein
MRAIVFPVLAGLASGSEPDGCRDPIRRASTVYVTGSPGYTVDCPALAASYSQMSYASPRQGHVFQSLLQSKRVDPIFDICFSGSESASQLTTAPYVEVNLDGAYVIRGLDFSTLSGRSGIRTPASLSFNARRTDSGQSSWFVSQTDADSGSAWSALAVGPHQLLDSDIAGQFLRVFPKLTASDTAANNYGFGFELYGCSASSTASVSFQFKTSQTAVVQQFSKLSIFVGQLSQFVCLVTKFVTAPGSCSRIVYAGIKSGSVANPLSGVGPSTLPTIEVTYRILPPSSRCTDCRTAAVVQAQLASDLGDPNSRASSIMKALETWIEDPNPYTCYNKICSDGTLCINGVCVKPADLEGQAAAQLAVQAQITSGSQIDNTLQLSPLNVISEADQTTGILTFNKTPVKAGTVLTNAGQTTATTVAPSSTNEETFLQRFLIPISVAGGVVVAIGGILAWKAYSRSHPA